jgi:hypothetical protein
MDRTIGDVPISADQLFGTYPTSQYISRIAFLMKAGQEPATTRCHFSFALMFRGSVRSRNRPSDHT